MSEQVSEEVERALAKLGNAKLSLRCVISKCIKLVSSVQHYCLLLCHGFYGNYRLFNS